VVLREAARRVGVSATAAYRHFENHTDLLRAVRQRAHQALAESMDATLTAAAPSPDARTEAVRRLHAIGSGYVTFA
jgi:AcrR family transcriptional regulator